MLFLAGWDLYANDSDTSERFGWLKCVDILTFIYDKPLKANVSINLDSRE